MQSEVNKEAIFHSSVALPNLGSENALVLLFSYIVTYTNKLNFERNLNQTFKDTKTWFNANLLTLNFNKTQYVEFRPMNYHNVTTQISYDQTKLTNETESKFLGLIIDSTLSWKQHIDYVIKKISIACYPLKNIKYFIPLDTLKVISFAHIHSIISYGIIIWGGSSYVNNVSILQKKSNYNHNKLQTKRVL
jgi:hypothetical protein